MFHGAGNLHYVHTLWCHEDGLYTSLNPLRNNPLVEGVKQLECRQTRQLQV